MTDFQNPLLVESQLFMNEHHLLVALGQRAQREFTQPTILNIGIWRGASCHCLRLGAPDAQLIAIDVMGTYAFTIPDLIDFLDMTVIKRNSNYVELIQPFQLVFVDGGHEYEVVCGDIRKFCSQIVKGGYAAFHDAGRQEIQRALSECMPEIGEWEKLPESTSNLLCMRRL